MSKYLWGLMIILAGELIGCRQGASPTSPVNTSGVTRTYDKPVPAPPPANQVRITAQKIEENAKTVHWKWTIVGDRNWSGTEGIGQTVTLTHPYPLNATGQLGGTNAYDYDVIITANDVQGGGTDLSYSDSFQQIGTHISSKSASGSVSGGGVSGNGVLKRGSKRVAADQAVKALMTGEQTLPLPLDKPVLEITGQDADGKPFREMFRIRAAK